MNASPNPLRLSQANAARRISASIARGARLLSACIPCNPSLSFKSSRAGVEMMRAGTGAGGFGTQNVPTSQTDEKRPTVNALISQANSQSWDVGTLGTRLASREVCARIHEGAHRGAGRRAHTAMRLRARVCVPNVPTSQLLKYDRDINEVRLGRFSSVWDVGTFCRCAHAGMIGVFSSLANKILPENQRVRGEG